MAAATRGTGILGPHFPTVAGVGTFAHWENGEFPPPCHQYKLKDTKAKAKIEEVRRANMDTVVQRRGQEFEIS
jgi:hypothetical protein